MLQYLTTCLSISVAALILFYLSRKLNNWRKLPPGPIRWPIIGSLPQLMMINRAYPHLQLCGLAKTYGGIVSFGYGVHYAVVVSNFEIMVDLFKRPETSFERVRYEFFELRTDFKNLGIATSYGDVWKEQKKWTVKLLREFGFGKHTMDETLRDEVNDLIADIKSEIESSKGVWEVKCSRFSSCQINIMWASIAGYRFDPHSSELNRQLHLSNQIFESFMPSNLLSAFPFLKIFPVLSGYRNYYELHKEFREFIRELIVETKGRSEGNTKPENFIEAYLDKIEICKSFPNSNFNENQLEAIVMDLFITGTDTTATFVLWLVLYISLNAHVQTKARDEIRRILEIQQSPISCSDMTRLPYIYAIMLETMRHSPMIIGGPPRRVSEDLDCAGYKIPKGTHLFQNFYPIFHDHAFWGDPEVFRPDRFLLHNGTLDKSKTDRVIQFGLGTRACPGENMAVATVFMIIVGLLQKFSFGLVKGREAEPEFGTPSITLQPKPFALQVEVVH